MGSTTMGAKSREDSRRSASSCVSSRSAAPTTCRHSSCTSATISSASPLAPVIATPLPIPPSLTLQTQIRKCGDAHDARMMKEMDVVVPQDRELSVFLGFLHVYDEQFVIRVGVKEPFFINVDPKLHTLLSGHEQTVRDRLKSSEGDIDAFMVELKEIAVGCFLLFSYR